MANVPDDDGKPTASSSSAARQRKESRHPDIAIYKPGQSRLGKRPDEEKASPTKNETTSSSTTTRSSQASANAAKKERAKPPSYGEKDHKRPVRDRDNDGGSSSARGNERRNHSKDQRSHRDNRKNPDHSERSANSRPNRSERPRADSDRNSDRNSGRGPSKEQQGRNNQRGADLRVDHKSAGNKARGETQGDVPEGKPVHGREQPPKRWQGPQGKRKLNHDAVGATGVSPKADDADGPTQTSGQRGKSLDKAPAKSLTGEMAPSNSRRGNNQRDNREPRTESRGGRSDRSRQESEGTEAGAKLSETGSNHSAKHRKPERSFYVSPNLAPSESMMEEAKSGASDPAPNSGVERPQERVAPEEAVETMIFTSRKTSQKNWPKKGNAGDGRNVAAPKDPSSEKSSLENDRKAPLKSLLDLRLSQPGATASQADATPPKEALSHAETRSKAGPQSKRYSAKRLRQRYNSGSSTGSDNSQFVDAPLVPKPAGWDRELAGADAKLQTLSLDRERDVDSRDSPSGLDSGATAPQNHRPQNQSLKRQQHARESAREEPERGGEARDQRRPAADRGKLSVTFNSRVREVEISPEEEEEGNRGRMPIEERGRGRADVKKTRPPDRQPRKSAKEPESAQGNQTSKEGGLIRLGPKRSDPIPVRPQPHPADQPEPGYKPIYDRYYAPPPPSSCSLSPKDEPRPGKDPRGRHGNRKLLWDPSKPAEKPALASSAKKPEVATSDLHFYDPEHEGGSPKDYYGLEQRRQFPPQGYGYYPAQQQQQQAMPASSGLQSSGYYPAMSWAEQVEAQAADHQSLSGSPAQIPHYQGNFPPLGAASLVAQEPAPPAEGHAHHPEGVAHRESPPAVAFRVLQDTVRYEHSLNNAVSRRFHGDESVLKIMKLSQTLEQMYAQVILTDLETCNKHSVEQLMWKSAYYQLIEALRKQEIEAEESGVYKRHLEQLLDHGCDFYVDLLEKLQSAYHFNLENHKGLDPLQEEPRRTIKLALLSTQRCMISLGDIARYKELTNDTNNYGKARSWYLKAQHLAPRNGRPYNQLAILALYTRRKLDAVYYYMRSLAASNPFLTARESLMSLFEEVRRKVEHKERAEAQAKQEKEEAREAERRARRRGGGGGGGRKGRHGNGEDGGTTRREVWIASDGTSHDGSELAEDGEEEDEEEALKRVSPVEINKKFVLSLLNVHGKLFTRIGLEYSEFITDRLLKEFSVLLTHSPTPITSTRLIQAMAINMFAAHNTQTKDQSPGEDMRSLLQEQSIQLGLDMFGLLVQRCNQLLIDHLASDTRRRVLLSEDLLELLPGVKVYADWLMCHPHLWNPPPCCTQKPYSAAVDVWCCLADLLNTLKRIDTTIIQFIKKTDDNNCQEILLPEDVQLSGFVPLLSLPLQPVYVPNNTDKMEAMDCVRIISLLLFGEYACGQETPLLAYDVTKNCYISVAPEMVAMQPDTGGPYQNDDDVIIEEDDSEDENGNSEAQDSGDIGGLRQRKEDLERRLQEQKDKQKQMQATVERHRKQRTVEIEIRPLYLVPDTNCFIDHLTKIQALLACRKYKLVVPLVVINELDGLAKGSRADQYEDLEQAHKVQEGAEMSIRCLEGKFEQRNKYLRALTSKGTVMDTIAYRSEERDFKVCNDDLILKCGLHYVDDRARDFMPSNPDSPIRLYRDIVLLTNDRNLRLKALQQNVPVKDIMAFTKWAKV